jgi:hypothetical protein
VASTVDTRTAQSSSKPDAEKQFQIKLEAALNSEEKKSPPKLRKLITLKGKKPNVQVGMGTSSDGACIFEGHTSIK